MVGPKLLLGELKVCTKRGKKKIENLIKNGVKRKKTHFTIVTSKNETVQSIVSYFFKTMKGMKSLEYRIWARSFNKKHRGFNYLLEIRKKMRNIRAIRFDKSWKELNNFKD